MYKKFLSLSLLVLGVWGVGTHQAQATSASTLVQVSGITAQDNFGYTITSGDLNGDGLDEMIVGAYQATFGGIQTGGVYIIYGSTTPLADQNANASNVVIYSGETQYDWTGLAVATADLDADGYDDLIVGAPQNADGGATAAGAAYIIYGSSTQLAGGSLSTVVQLTDSQALGYAGYGVGGLGDIDGDGYEDVAIGAPLYDVSGGNEGVTYVLYGSATRYTSSTLSSAGTRFVGETASDFFGEVTSAAGDLNNDGYDDWLVGAYGYASNDVGAMYVVYGSATRPTAGSASQFVRLTGETASDQVGYFARPAGDLNVDGYDDFLIGVANADYTGLTDVGILYVVYGSSTALTSQSLSFTPKIIGAAASDFFGLHASAGDTNNDGYPELFVGAPYNDDAGNSAGAAYLIGGQSTQLTTGGISSFNPTTWTGEATADLFGYGAFLADLNGDGIQEVLVGAPYNDTNASLAGATYVGYLRIDLDGDGVLSSGGILETGTDCNDADGTVSANQTYYLDADDDGLGVDDTTTSVCSSTAPDGYADNANDTNDSVMNNGIEIDGDEVDNDGDGEIDEVNTIAENGRHPEYRLVDPTDPDTVADAVVRVKSTQNGKIRVRYADNSVYVYKAFTADLSNPVRLKQYPEYGYYVAMLSTGRKIALVNVLNGRVLDRDKIGGPAYGKHDLQFSDLRDDGVLDLIIASKRNTTVRVTVAAVNLTVKEFRRVVSLVVEAPGAVVSNTTVVDNTIDIRSKTSPLVSILVTKQHLLRVLE